MPHCLGCGAYTAVSAFCEIYNKRQDCIDKFLRTEAPHLFKSEQPTDEKVTIPWI